MLTSISVILRYGVRCNVAVLLSCVTVVVPVVTIRTPEGPYFLFSRALYPFLIHSHTYSLLSPTASHAYLPFVVSFPPFVRNLPFPGSTYPRMYLVRTLVLVIVA